jgi:dihydropteroate synthase
MPVSVQAELDRLMPVIEGLRDCGVPLSIDTVKPEVMRVAIAASVDMINDIAALNAPGALEVVAASQTAVCLMHMQGEPRTMQADPHYDDVVAEVAAFLADRVAACEAAGIANNCIVIDPGFGFGKTLGHNLALLRHLDRFVGTELPVLVGLSRKSMLGLITGRTVGERVPASVAVALLAVQKGAAMVRVHDVAATRDALAVLEATEGA